MYYLKIFLIVFLKLFFVQLIWAQWPPPGAVLSHPVVLCDNNSRVGVINALNTDPHHTLFTSVWNYGMMPAPPNNSSDGERQVRAWHAQESAFLLYIGMKPTENGLMVMTIEDSLFLVTKVVGLLEEINSEVGYESGWVFYQEWQHRSKELLFYLMAYDWLLGCGLGEVELALAQQQIVIFTANLFERVLAPYPNPVPIFPDLYFFDFQFNNHSLMVSSTLALAATILADFIGEGFYDNPENWFNVGLWNLDNTLFVEDGLFPRVSEPDALAGYAEGPNYYAYAFENVLPFVNSMSRFFPDLDLNVQYQSVLRTIRNPFYDERYIRFPEWMSRIRLPDGSYPAIHDSRNGFRTPINVFFQLPQYHYYDDYTLCNVPKFRTQFLCTLNEPQGIMYDGAMVMAESGSVVFRDTSEGVYVHFIGKSGIPLRGAKSHHQGDAGSFIMMNKDKMMMLDAGYAGANQSAWVNGYNNHNTMLVDYTGPLPPTGEFVSVETNQVDLDTNFLSEEIDYVRMGLFYKETAIERNIVRIGHRCYFLVDEFVSELPHNYTIQFHGQGVEEGEIASETGRFEWLQDKGVGLWQCYDEGLAVYAGYVGNNAQHEIVLDSAVLAGGYFVEHSKLLIHSPVVKKGTFVSLMAPFSYESPDLYQLEYQENAMAICSGEEDYFWGLIASDQDTIQFFKDEDSLISVADWIFYEKLQNNGYSLYMDEGRYVQISSQPMIIADKLIRFFVHHRQDTIKGFVDRACVVNLYTGQKMILHEGAISYIDYDKVTGVSVLHFTEATHFILQYSGVEIRDVESKKVAIKLVSANPSSGESYTFVRMNIYDKGEWALFNSAGKEIDRALIPQGSDMFTLHVNIPGIYQLYYRDNQFSETYQLIKY